MPTQKRVNQQRRLAAVGRGSSRYSYDNPGPFGKVGRYLGGLAGGMAGGAAGGAAGLALPGMFAPLTPAGMVMGGPVGVKAAKFLATAGAAGGRAAGSKLGSYAHYIGKIFGSGDYVTASDGVRSNVFMDSKGGSQIPQFAGRSEVRIRHREFLGDVISSATASTFNIQQYPINPGLTQTFPWLAEVCGTTFQQYRINGMVFEFRSMSADALNSTNTALGSVVMATDYDSKDAPFGTKQQMENTMFGVSCKPSSSMIHAIECARTQTSVSELYIRNNAVPSGADVRLYDLGNFYIATTGCQGTNVNLGELWVSFDVSLLKPIEQPPGFGYKLAHYNLSGASAATPLALDTTVNAVQPVFDSIGMVSRSNTAIVFPLSLMTSSYIYIVLMVRGGSTASVVSPIVTGSGGFVTGGGFINDASSGWTTPSSTTTTCTTGTLWRYDGSGTPALPPTITFGVAGLYPGATLQGGDLHIMLVNPGISV